MFVEKRIILSKKFDLNWLKIRQWHAELLKKAWPLADECLAIDSVTPNQRKLVEHLVTETDLVESLGGIKHLHLEVSESNLEYSSYNEWYLHFWGRRCAFYLSSLARGLKASLVVTKSDEKKIKELENLAQHLSEAFRSTLDLESVLRKSQRRQVVDKLSLLNLRLTYLDPILFTALYLLSKKRLL